jgi:hypothetical protein
MERIMRINDLDGKTPDEALSMENKTGVRHNTADARPGFRVEIRSGSFTCLF